MRAAPTFWRTLAVNLAVLWVTIVLGFVAHLEGAVRLPLVSLAGTGTLGLVGLLSRRTRRAAVACIGGTVASAALFAALLALFFVTYFVLGGNELS